MRGCGRERGRPLAPWYKSDAHPPPVQIGRTSPPGTNRTHMPPKYKSDAHLPPPLCTYKGGAEGVGWGARLQQRAREGARRGPAVAAPSRRRTRQRWRSASRPTRRRRQPPGGPPPSPGGGRSPARARGRDEERELLHPQNDHAPPPRTKWTRRVPHPVLIGHGVVACLCVLVRTRGVGSL